MHYQNSVLKNSRDSRFLCSPNQPEAEHHLAPDCCCWPPRTAKRGRFCSPKPGLRTEGGGTTGPGTPLHPRKHNLAARHLLISFPCELQEQTPPPPFPYRLSSSQPRTLMAVLEAAPQLVPWCLWLKHHCPHSPPPPTLTHRHTTFIRFS